MFRNLVFALTLLGTTAAWAQTAYDPKIAYVQASGGSAYLYLANADGTRAVRVATVGRGEFPGNIYGVDFAPGGGKIAYSDAQGLWVLSYTATNSTIRVDKRDLRVPGGSGILIGPPDFSPDGSRILYGTNSPSYSFRAIPTDAGPSVLLYDGPYAGPNESVRWLRPVDMGNALAFLTPISVPNGSMGYEIWTVLLDANDQVTSAGPLLSTATQTFTAIRDFDIAHTRNALLISVYYPTPGYRIIELDIGTGNIAPTEASGIRVHYSADDSRIISVSSSFDYVTSFNPSSGVLTRLTKKGTYSRTDARP